MWKFEFSHFLLTNQFSQNLFFSRIGAGFFVFTYLDNEGRVTIGVNRSGSLTLRTLSRHPGSRACVASDAATRTALLKVTRAPLLSYLQPLQHLQKYADGHDYFFLSWSVLYSIYFFKIDLFRIYYFYFPLQIVKCEKFYTLNLRMHLGSIFKVSRLIY